MRLFFALWPPAATARALARWAGEVQRESGGRAAAEETIHLTLAFLGEAEPTRAIQAGRKVKGGAFELKIDTARYWKHNRIVWVGPGEMPLELDGFVKRLHDSLREGGFVLEDRPFAAHISLVRKANPPTSMPPLPAVEWPGREFLLVCSTPTGNGSRYEPVERFALT